MWSEVRRVLVGMDGLEVLLVTFSVDFYLTIFAKKRMASLAIIL